MESIDYKNKYEQAIKRAKSKIKNDKDHVLYEDDVIEIFPELAESEDEIIIKDIIHHIEFECNHSIIPHQRAKQWIAWLEKQGEQKPAPDWMLKFLDELRAKKNYFDWDEHRDIEGGILAIIDWIVHQSTWKPSEEQMKSLRWVIEYGNTTQTETLKGIYEQLKKLREE